MIMPAKKTPAPQEQENMPTQEHKASADAAFLTEKGRSLYALVRRRWLPTVIHACASMLDVILEKLFAEKVYTYKKGEGYPEVEIRGNGVISVPLEELYRSTKARENLESMRKRMREAMIRQAEREEAKRKEGEKEAQRAHSNRPRRVATATKKRKRAAPEKLVD